MGHSGAFRGTSRAVEGTGPWKGGPGAGRARRGERVIVGSKNRVHVNLSGEPLFVNAVKGPFSDGKLQNFASKNDLSGWAKKPVFRDILAIFGNFFMIFSV